MMLSMLTSPSAITTEVGPESGRRRKVKDQRRRRHGPLFNAEN